MKTLKNIEAEEGTIKKLLLEDAKGELSYIKDVAENGCLGGSCNGLVYYEETHALYNKYAEEIDELVFELEYNITEGMKRLRQTDIRNFLAWLAYEVNAQNIIEEIEE